MLNKATAAESGLLVTPGRVRVTVADYGGWDLCLELDGMVFVEHCADWHRVERHRAVLEHTGLTRQPEAGPLA